MRAALIKLPPSYDLFYETGEKHLFSTSDLQLKKILQARSAEI